MFIDKEWVQELNSLKLFSTGWSMGVKPREQADNSGSVF